MTVADLLDGAAAIIKARPRRILGFTAVFVVPIYVVAAFLQRDIVDPDADRVFADDPTVTGELAEATTTSDLVATVLLQLGPAIALVCVAAALAHLVSHWSQGRDVSGGDMLATVGRRWWPLLASFVVVHVAEAVGLIGLFIGAWFVMPLFVVVAPVIGAEGASTRTALRRSVRLTRRRYWRTLGIALLIGLVGSVLSNIMSALPSTLALVIGFESGWPLLAVGGIVAQLLTLPFVATATVLLYLDLRVRTEGLDLEMAARRVLDRAA